RISRDCAPVTAPRTWPSYAISPSIWCAKSQTSDPSSGAASVPLGIPNTCWIYWGRGHVNLDSLPCINSMGGELGAKRLGLLRELLPQARRFGLLADSGAPAFESDI